MAYLSANIQNLVVPTPLELFEKRVLKHITEEQLSALKQETLNQICEKYDTAKYVYALWKFRVSIKDLSETIKDPELEDILEYLCIWLAQSGWKVIWSLPHDYKENGVVLEVKAR